ncbi:hypothetical protein D3C73_1601080 [compost metagenome]
MPSLIAVLAVAAGAFWLEVPGLVQKKRTRELRVFILFLLAGTLLVAAQYSELKLPNPLEIMKIIYRAAG